MEWDDATARWSVITTDGEVHPARAIVSGIGILHVPSVPEIPGAELFTGPAFHSARWDRSFDPSGKRVAVIGTGASAIQRGGSDFVAGRYASCGDGDALLFFRAVSFLLAVRQTRREKVANLQSAGSFRPE